MNSSANDCVGYIRLMFFDRAYGEAVQLGALGFMNDGNDEAAWSIVPACSGATSFIAERLDENRDIVDDRPVSAETCEGLLGATISQLIADGRTRLSAKRQAQRDGPRRDEAPSDEPLSCP